MNSKQLSSILLLMMFGLSAIGQQSFPMDSTVNLCRYKNDREYTQYYGKRNHFYLNDPERKFFNSKEISFEGVNFGFMKLVNPIEVSKSEFIKDKHMSLLSSRINGTEVYEEIDFGNKKVLHNANSSLESYKNLHPNTWISAEDYQLDARAIPFIIRQLKFSKTEGIGLLFIIEKFSKTDKVITGYWVAFDFATRKNLLMDYIYYNGVGVQSSNYGWVSYWETSLVGAGIYIPVSFQRYLDLTKKGEVELVCD